MPRLVGLCDVCCWLGPARFDANYIFLRSKLVGRLAALSPRRPPGDYIRSADGSWVQTGAPLLPAKHGKCKLVKKTDKEWKNRDRIATVNVTSPCPGIESRAGPGLLTHGTIGFKIHLSSCKLNCWIFHNLRCTDRRYPVLGENDEP